MDDETLRKLANVGIYLIECNYWDCDGRGRYCVVCEHYLSDDRSRGHANDCPIPEALEAYEELKKDG